MNNQVWNNKILKIPGAHILQTVQWGNIKEPVGWEASFHSWFDDDPAHRAAAMVLKRKVPLGKFPIEISILYVPRGPLLTDWEDVNSRITVMSNLETIAKETKAIFIKIDPDIPVASGLPGTQDEFLYPIGRDVFNQLQNRGWQLSSDQIQFRNTIVIDLNPDLDTILSRMKQKTRYNIRLASRKGVTVRLGSVHDIPTLTHMYAETSVRDGFVIREISYYEHTWKTFYNNEMMDILLAQVDGDIVAGLLLFHFGKTAWYMYGMSRNMHREKMPTYLLQWEAIKRAKFLGCTKYDLWGAPDTFKDTDPMWGVYKFKDGLGGQIIRTIGAWDYPVYPAFYQLYTKFLPKLLNLARNRGRSQTKQILGQ